MALPLAYNVESVRVRWRTSIVAVLGIAGSVGVFVAMLALAAGFKAALVTSGLPDNALVRRVGSSSEMDSVVTLEERMALEDAPEVARTKEGPLVSPEIVVIANLPLRRTGTDANVQVRGVSPRAFLVHRGVHIVEGRPFSPAMYEVVVGKNAVDAYGGLEPGGRLRMGGTQWAVVGVMDSGGSAFDSEIWCDGDLLAPAYQRPRNIYQSVVLRLTSQEALEPLRLRAASDPRLRIQVERETDYYAKASRMLSTLILGLGSLVAAVMGLGAVFAALNTMYSAVAERSREIATIRALGFTAKAVVFAFLMESLLIAVAGGALGGMAALSLNGLTTSTMNWSTFSHLSFAFQVTPSILLTGMAFALFMGVAGGLPPAVRAARLPVASALRDL